MRPYNFQKHEIREYTNVRKNSVKSILMLRNILNHENLMNVHSTDNVNTAFCVLSSKHFPCIIIIVARYRELRQNNIKMINLG